MTFIVSPKGVNNTEGTKAKLGGGGSVDVGGDFENSGVVEVDVRANLNVLGDILNSGSFSVRDYVSEGLIEKIVAAEASITDDDAKIMLRSIRENIPENIVVADSNLKRFVNYVKDHPTLITSAVQALLSIFS